MNESDTNSTEVSQLERPRVLMSAFACEPGRGSEQEVGWRWALEMSRWFDVTVITQTRNRPGIERELAKGLPEGRTLHIEYFQLPEPIYRLKSRFDPLTWPYYAVWQWAMLRVVKKLHAEKPFVLAHHVTFVSFRIPVWLKKLGIPVVFGPVGGADKAPGKLLHKGFGFGIRCKERVRNLMTDVGRLVMQVFRPLAKRNAKRNGLCLAATPAMAAIFDQTGMPNEVFPAIGMDPGEPRKTERGGENEGVRFLFVGRFHPLKGTHLLIEAFAKADIEGAQLTLVGGGSDEPKLRALAEGLGVSDKLTWTGKLPRQELYKYYQDHDVLIAPSLYESGGLVALEAMAEGIPVIVLDVGGHSVSVTEGCGIKVSPMGDVEGVISRLSDAMQSYAGNPQQMVEDGIRARQRIVEGYDWGRKAHRMNEVYQQLTSP